MPNSSDLNKKSKAFIRVDKEVPHEEAREAATELQTHEPGGLQLLDAVANLTGLPETLVQAELNDIVQTSGHTASDLTLDELRAAMLEYLESMRMDLEAQDQLDAQTDAALCGTRPAFF